MVKQKRTNISVMIFVALAIVLFFLYINNPFSEVQEMANSNLILIGAIGILVVGGSTGLFYDVNGRKDLVNDTAVGIILGFLGVFLISIMLAGFGVLSLAGSISPASIASISSSDQIFFIALVYPFTETLILIGGGLFLYNILKSIKVLPFPKLFAGFGIMFLFAGFHFTALSAGQYEYSFSGFINFIGNTENFASSAFPQMLMGLYWVMLGFGFRSWIVPATAHVVNNTVSLYTILGLNPVLIALFVLYIGIVGIIWWKTSFKEFSTFSVKEMLT